MMPGKLLLLIVLTFIMLPTVQATESPNSEVLYYKQHVQIENGQMLTTDSVAFQINNKYGEEEISVVYDKLNKLKNFKVWLEDAKGISVGVMPKNAFEDRNLYQETSLYNDLRERVCNTNYPYYPHRIFYTSTVVTKSILSLAHWEPLSLPSKPLAMAELWIHRPSAYPVHTLIKGAVQVSENTANGQVTTRYFLKPSCLSEEALQNPAVVKNPNLVWVVPDQINYGVQGSTSSWSTFGNWVDELNKGLTALPESEKYTVRSLILGMKDTVSMVRTLYHYMQDHTRYVSVQLGIGGMKSYPASYVSVNKFGDCKALSMYMKALLECVGIDSHLVLIERDEYPDPFYTEFPISQFNHVLLAVPVANDTIWLENTSSTGAMGYVDVTTQNRPALLVDGKNSRLVRTPALSPCDLTGCRTMKVKCTPDGDASILVRHLGRGWEYEYMNSLNKEVSAKSQFIYLDRFIQFKHYEMDRFEFQTVNRDSMFAKLEIAFRMPRFLQGAQDRVFLPQIPVYQGALRFFKPDTNTLHYTFPVFETDTVFYQLSGKLNLENLPDPCSVSCPYGKFTSVYTLSGSTLMGVKTFSVMSGTYDPTSYRTLYDFIQKVSESEKKSIVLIK
jgi:hypothetical protein